MEDPSSRPRPRRVSGREDRPNGLQGDTSNLTGVPTGSSPGCADVSSNLSSLVFHFIPLNARVEPTPRSRTPASLPRLTCPGATSTGSFRLTSASAPPQRWSARAAPRETRLVRNDDRLDRSAVWVCHPYRFSLRLVPWPNYSLRGLSLRGTRPSDSAERRRWMRPALDSGLRPRLTP